MIENIDSRHISFSLGGMYFEYDEEKNQKNIEKHGISFKNAARVFFDYDRIELYDEENSIDEERYNTIGDVSAGKVSHNETVIGSIGMRTGRSEDILFVVYTDRVWRTTEGTETTAIRLISARFATRFERKLYYGEIR